METLLPLVGEWGWVEGRKRGKITGPASGFFTTISLYDVKSRWRNYEVRY